METTLSLVASHWLPFLGLLAAGAAAGILAGLLGVGGGIVIVPVLYVFLDTFELTDTRVTMTVAVATSLATILVTAVSSARSHHRRGAVDRTLLKSWGPAVFLGVIIGTAVGGLVHGDVLTAVFAAVAISAAVNAFRPQGKKLLKEGFPNRIVSSASGGLVGLFSAMMGIGGGTLAVPILTAFGYDIRRAVGTSAALGFVIALPATLGYILSGWGVQGLPPGSLGYVSLPAFLAFVPLTALFAPLGARIAHAIPPAALRYCFGGFLLLTATRLTMSLF